jgi:hypothetical protein
MELSMNAKIYKFPEFKKNIGYKISLYNDIEIFITVTVLNIFSNIQNKITENTLSTLDPVIVIDALERARTSDLFSQNYKKVIYNILKQIESVELRG